VQLIFTNTVYNGILTHVNKCDTKQKPKKHVAPHYAVFSAQFTSQKYTHKISKREFSGKHKHFQINTFHN